MSGLTMQGIINDTSLMVQGNGVQASNALSSVGLGNTLIARVDPLSGSVDMNKTPDAILAVSDPKLKLERNAQPENTMGIITPSLNSGPSR